MIRRLDTLADSGGAEVKEVRALAERARDTLDDLLRFADSPDASRITIDLAQLIDAALNLARDSLSAAGVRVEKRIEGTHEVQVDPSSIQQLFVNLVQNACEAMAGSPERSLEIKVTDWKDRILVVVTTAVPGSPST